MRAMLQIGLTVVLFVVLTVAANGQTFTVLHYFTGLADGANPHAGLTMDSQGNFYGTASTGGPAGFNCGSGVPGCGTVFELKATADGWVFIPLYSFTGGADGGNPWGRVVIGPDGTLYGTTAAGGDVFCTDQGLSGCGTVFNLRPPATICRAALCPWVLTTLHTFTGGQNDGATPLGAITFDRAGNIYGTTMAGGGTQLNCGALNWGILTCGTAFELSPSAGGWTETILYRFSENDGNPAAALTLDAAGNLYGTLDGGSVVFELIPSGSGWVESTLYSLGITSGFDPVSDVIFDSAGNLYATTQLDGAYGDGTVVELTPSAGTWDLAKVYRFTPAYGNPGPEAGVTMDNAGNLYGTDYSAGLGFGTVFELTPSQCCFTYKLLHGFNGYDGGGPVGTVSIDAHGNLYGTTLTTYAPYWGTIWEIMP